jgi:nucleoid DNA-binding protein
MAKKAGAEALSEGQFVELVNERLGEAEVSVNKADLRKIVTAVKDEIVDCIVNGYKVKLNGVASFEAKFVPEKKKGEPVRNPATGETAPRAKTTPAAFKGSVRVSPSIKAKFPPTKSSDGRDLAVRLVGKAAARKGGVRV